MNDLLHPASPIAAGEASFLDGLRLPESGFARDQSFRHAHCCNLPARVPENTHLAPAICPSHFALATMAELRACKVPLALSMLWPLQSEKLNRMAQTFRNCFMRGIAASYTGYYSYGRATSAVPSSSAHVVEGVGRCLGNLCISPPLSNPRLWSELISAWTVPSSMLEARTVSRDGRAYRPNLPKAKAQSAARSTRSLNPDLLGADWIRYE